MVWKRVLLITILLVALFVGSTGVLAEVNVLDIPWWTVDGGGGSSGGGNFTLSGTIGQPDAGVLVGGPYTLNGGFWVGAGTPGGGYVHHLPLILKNP